VIGKPAAQFMNRDQRHCLGAFIDHSTAGDDDISHFSPITFFAI
jgi:hypothetical protein